MRRPRCEIPVRGSRTGLPFHIERHNLAEWRARLVLPTRTIELAFERPCPHNLLRAFGGGWLHELGLTVGSRTLIVNLWSSRLRIDVRPADTEAA